MNDQMLNALVTSKGILFQGKYYSCERAIRERWFELAHIYGEWTVQVASNDYEAIYLPLGDGREVCRIIIEQEYEGSKLERYFLSIQALKKEWKTSQKRRRQRTIRSLHKLETKKNSIFGIEAEVD